MITTFGFIPSAINGVGRREDGASCIEGGGDAGFGDGDGLLLHSFVNRDSIVFPHFVEFVDAHHATIGQYLNKNDKINN